MAGTVTALEVQKRNKERVNVYIDDEFAFGLNLLDAASLKKGQALTEAQINALKSRDDVAQALDTAVRFLAARPRSITEIRRRLAKKDIEEAVVEEVIDRLMTLNYVDDLEFARFWVRNREDFNPRGPMALRYELRQKGLADSIIDQVLAELDPEDSAYRAAQKKFRSLRGKEPDEQRTKVGAFLNRRGFSYDVVRTVLDRIVQEQEEGEVDGFTGNE
jgi:regulatory protein